MLKGFQLFGRTNNKRMRVTAWHSPHSLTWRWAIYWSLERTAVRPRFYWHRLNGDKLLHWTICFLGGRVSFHQQRPMWYRDMYNKEHRP